MSTRGRRAPVLFLGGAALAAGLPTLAGPSAAPDPRPSADEPVVTVHKSPSCGCCGAWEDHLRGPARRGRLAAALRSV